MEKIKLYTIDCPKCKILKEKLIEKNIDFETVDDTDIIINEGYEEMNFPFLKINDKILQFGEACNFIKIYNENSFEKEYDAIWDTQ